MLKQFENQFFSYVKSVMNHDQAHNINHILRVVKTAKALCHDENGKLEVVLPAAYLHDCFSFPKNHPSRSQSSSIAAEKATQFLHSISYPNEYFIEINHAIVAHSFSANIPPTTLEAQIVQDADRLDALGAIGIARCLQVGTNLGIELYNSEDPFCHARTPDDSCYSIDHFYTKLFKLVETMNTDSAKIEAKKRVTFMKEYLRQLETEISIATSV
ncbi:HD domain-containing protein [Psychromonas sp. PT13]|uniref:HD domain-containing protein n=1 Tax=Psychromonas sp. PT13 TaxID=3439547 RepID=UPI003EBF2BB5